MKNLMVIMAGLLAITLATGCSSDKVTLPDHNGRISDLERRMKLNEDLDAAQSALIAINDSRITVLEGQMVALQAEVDQVESDLAAEQAARAQGDADLAALIAAEQAAREAGDQANADALAAAIAQQNAKNAQQDNKINTLNALAAAQAVIDILLQAQINAINSKFPTINNKLNSLQSQVNNLNADLNSLESQVATLQGELLNLQGDIATINNNVTNIDVALAALELRVDVLESTDLVPGPMGPPGPQGPVGPTGPAGAAGGATVTTISLSGSPSCKSTGVGSIYARRDGEKVKLYGNLNDCNDQDDRIAELDPTPQSGQNAYFWLASDKLAVTDGSSSANLKIIDFN